jgi:hypothetical protein
VIAAQGVDREEAARLSIWFEHDDEAAPRAFKLMAASGAKIKQKRSRQGGHGRRPKGGVTPSYRWRFLVITVR